MTITPDNILPAALRQDQAAAYCGLSVGLFEKLCPVKPIRFTKSSHGKRYPRKRLDEWLDTLDPNDKVKSGRFGEKAGGQSAA